MAKFTTNYNLEKPAQNEFYNVAVQNQNMDIIDQALAEAGNNPQLEADVAGIKDEVGTTADTGGSETGGTIFAKLNKIIRDVLGMITSIGNTTDTGATEITGTVMGKLNAILNVATLKKKTHQAIYTIPADTYTAIGQVILNVVGQGEFYGLSSTLLKSIKIIVDDSEEIISAASTNASGYIYPRLSMDFTNTTLSSTSTFKGYAPLTFNTSLKIITNSSGTKSSGAHDIKMGYALYE